MAAFLGNSGKKGTQGFGCTVIIAHVKLSSCLKIHIQLLFFRCCNPISFPRVLINPYNAGSCAMVIFHCHVSFQGGTSMYFLIQYRRPVQYIRIYQHQIFPQLEPSWPPWVSGKLQTLKFFQFLSCGFFLHGNLRGPQPQSHVSPRNSRPYSGVKEKPWTLNTPLEGEGGIWGVGPLDSHDFLLFIIF